ncbi:NfeD family protein [Paenibacillus aestuarii]|uniref:NfeD family protein n=1 Tax=Paenibacillus aestuarii TaxID=516965 RepID=A0ABW0K736_9BACL|nr:NfeD family protein [Paenibacillus aestuarii]
MLWILWCILAVLLVIVELSTGTFYFLVLACSALTAMVSAWFHLSLLIQVAVFTISAFLFYVCLLPSIRKLIPASKETLPSIDRFIGQKAYVISEIKPGEVGLVKLNSELWSAIADENIREGEEVIVIEVKVSKLYVRKPSIDDLSKEDK